MLQEIIFLLIATLPILWAILIFNKLIRNRNRVEAAWSDIDVQLARRHDLIPQLVKAVKQYAKYEKTSFEAITELRRQAQAAIELNQRGRAETKLSESLIQLIAIAESYPELKASENFLQLQKELVEVENFLQSARRYYNGAVREFHTSIEIFPNNMLVQVIRFDEYLYFEMDDSVRKLTENTA